MRLVQFQILVALKQYGSFSQAARELYLSQPSISMAVKELESELGYAILIRSKKGVVFTPRGEWVLQRAITIMEAVEELQPRVKEEKWDPVRIAVPFHLCNTVLLDSKIHLENQYPQFSMQLEGNDDANDVLRQLKDNRLDLGIVYTMSLDEEQFFRRVDAGEWTFQELYQDCACVSVRDCHPLASRTSVKPEEVLQYPYITYREHNNRFFHQMIDACGQTPQMIRASDVALIRRMLLSFDSIACISRNAMSDGNRFFQGKMVPLPLEESRRWRFRAGIVFCKPSLNEAEQLLMDQVAALAGQYRRDEK